MEDKKDDRSWREKKPHGKPTDPNNPFRIGQVNDRGMTICGAKNRRGEPCGNTAIFENGRCRMHGGRAPVGVLNPNTKHGRYSKAIPKRLADAFSYSVDDPALLELTQEIALIDSRVGELLERIEKFNADGGENWAELLKHWDKLTIAARVGDGRQQAVQAEIIGRIIERGNNEFAAWDQLIRLLNERRKLSESERKRRIDAKSMIPMETVYLIISRHTQAMIAAVERFVDDRKTVHKIRGAASDELRRITIERGAT